ncbi:MAG: FliA/WhiG family RNA polymerase sigma factor [bacterium]|nr:FliA/WhiG family RNA polymerase sigma factor [bacterium]
MQTNDETMTNALKAQASGAYARQSREMDEEKWIVENLPMVSRMARKIASYLTKEADMEDLISAGTLGLVRAARAYDPGRDAEFRTYAYIRVRGAIIDELRAKSFVPATVHRRIKKVREIYERLTAQTGKAPSDEALAAEAGLTINQLYQLFQKARKQQFLSIHGLSDEAPTLDSLMPADRAPTPDKQAEHKETIARMTAAIADLPKRDRILLLLYYQRELSMKEIAQVLEITESRVSQLHAGLLFKLSVRLK